MRHARPDHSDQDLLGQVVASYGQRVLVEDASATRHLCILSGRRLRAVCGDRVKWRDTEDHGDGIVTGVLARETELLRPDKRGRVEVIAANLTRLLAVGAPRPSPDPFMMDRYLAAGIFMNITPTIVFNKVDLCEEISATDQTDLDDFRRIGHVVIRTSTKTGEGLEELRELLKKQTAILVGQSGVGKSSLLNVLVPEADAATRTLSSASGEGRHTTSASVLHRLPDGGAVIDSPGVRDYAPAPVPAIEVVQGFAEFAEPASGCRFGNCMHLREPDCGVKQAVKEESISARRYESYRRLVALMRKFEAKS